MFSEYANNLDTPASSNLFILGSAKVFGESSSEFHTAQTKSGKNNWHF